jgi:4-azaleucine resistance transporter AzlC
MSASPTEAVSPRRGWLTGITRAIPIVLGYFPIGIAYGVLAQKAGISTLNTVLMSILVYAGSSRLIAVGLFEAGVPVLSIVITTFIVNLRHLLMSAALAPYLNRWKRLHLPIFACQLTDETFAVHSARFASAGADVAEASATNTAAQVAWVSGGWLGTMLGQAVTDVKSLALDYVLSALFIALMVLQIKDRVHIAAAATAGILSVILLQTGFGQWNVITATLIGATVGVVLETWIRKPSS